MLTLEHRLSLAGGAALALLCGPAQALTCADLSYTPIPVGAEIRALAGVLNVVGDFANALNESNDTVGEALLTHDGARGYRGFLYVQGQGAVLLPGLPGHPNTLAKDVSDRDADGIVHIVGDALDSIYSRSGRAVRWTYRIGDTGATLLRIEDLGTLPGDATASANATNNAGIVVGTSHYRFGFVPVQFGPPVADIRGDALEFWVDPVDINDAGQVVAFNLRKSLATGATESLGFPPPRSTGATVLRYQSVQATGINASGQVSATTVSASGDGAGGFIQDAHRYTDGVGWEYLFGGNSLDGATGIGDDGSVTGIVGFGLDTFGVVYLQSLGATCVVDELIPDNLNASGDARYPVEVVNDINASGAMAGRMSRTAGGAVLLVPAGGTGGDTGGDTGGTDDTGGGTGGDTGGTGDTGGGTGGDTGGTGDTGGGTGGDTGGTGDTGGGTGGDTGGTGDTGGDAGGDPGTGGGTSPPADTTAPRILRLDVPDPARRTVQIRVTARDEVALAAIAIQVDGSRLCSGTPDRRGRLSCSWDTRAASNGRHEVRAVATDSSANSSPPTVVTVEVRNGVSRTSGGGKSRRGGRRR